MVLFNELSITPDGKNLIIDISVKNDSYYTNVYLDTIYIDTQDTYVDGGPSENRIFEYHIVQPGAKTFKIQLDRADLMNISLNDNLFFVYIKTRGVPSPDTPCGGDQTYTLGVVFNTCNIYNYMMQSIRDTLKECAIPKHFIDSYLRYKAFIVAINTEHYAEAIKFYNKFFKNIPSTTNIGCGCNG